MRIVYLPHFLSSLYFVSDQTFPTYGHNCFLFRFLWITWYIYISLKYVTVLRQVRGKSSLTITYFLAKSWHICWNFFAFIYRLDSVHYYLLNITWPDDNVYSFKGYFVVFSWDLHGMTFSVPLKIRKKYRKLLKNWLKCLLTPFKISCWFGKKARDALHLMFPNFHFLSQDVCESQALSFWSRSIRTLRTIIFFFKSTIFSLVWCL